ncbi:TraB/GumN family protein [Peptoniphilus mikwangii]|uniref:TraB/GumN family protein n=1 Tax=Peptoniphilus mikwangii TaxID=1354300 RepID=UPI0003FE2C98|nr:TraB/GumN family protein [Peptoniphilus mikwangii]
MKKTQKFITLLIFILFFNITNSFAKENQPVKFSSWATLALDNAAKAGIYSPDYMTSGKDFTKEITQKEIEELDKNTRMKLSTYKLEKNPVFKTINVEKNSSRKNILYNIFNLMSLYDKDINNNTDVIKYLTENKILIGDGKNLELDKKANYEQAVVFYNRALENIINKNNLGSKGIFFKIENNGNTVYLFGSIHVGNSSMYPIDRNVIDAFNSSNELYVEANISNAESIKYIQSKMIRTDGKTVKDDLGEENYSKLKNYMDGYKIPENNYANLNIWSLNSLITSLPIQSKNPYASAFGIDTYFISKANTMGKTIKELESTKFQIDLLSDFSPEKYKQMIIGFLDSPESKSTEKFLEPISKMQSLWIEGNRESLSKMIVKQDDFTITLFKDRDVMMADKISEMLNSKDKKIYFVVAGAGHFAPDDSVVKYLKDKNFKVENLNIN